MQQSAPFFSKLFRVAVTLGGIVRDARRRRDLTQDELAEVLGVSRETVSQLERGRPKKPLDPDFVNRLASHLELPVIDLVLALGYNVRFEGIGNDQEVALLELYRQSPPQYQRAVLRGLQELALDLDGGS